jgi:large subunit ribosomal protein L22
MGSRKKLRAEAIKESRKNVAMAKLRNYPTSPRKMRLVADMVRGLPVEKALFLLKNSPKHASKPLEKLIVSAMFNWEQKNEGARIDEAGLYISSISVDSARMLKRIQPAPQGRAHRIRKRSNHVTVILDAKYREVVAETEVIEESNETKD